MSDEIIPHLRVKVSWIIGILAAFLLFVVIAAYSAHMTYVYTTYDQERAKERYVILKKVTETENKALNTVAWVSQEKKIISIPIDEAMAKEIETLKTKSLGEGGVIPGTVPVPPPAPATSVAAAPAAGATTTKAEKPKAETTSKTAPATNAAPATPTAPKKESK